MPRTKKSFSVELNSKSVRRIELYSNVCTDIEHLTEKYMKDVFTIFVGIVTKIFYKKETLHIYNGFLMICKNLPVCLILRKGNGPSQLH